MKIRLSVLILEYIFVGIQLSNSVYAEPLVGDNVRKVEQKDFEKGKLSSVVSISYKTDRLSEEDTHFCTGVLISNNLILTAAHCFRRKLWGEIRVIVGSVDLRHGKKYYPEKWITYDRWAEIGNEKKTFSFNDIAIIKLSEKVKSSIAVSASLTAKKNSELIDKEVLLVGWGITKENPNQASRYLNSVDIKILNSKDCETFIRKLLKKNIVISGQYFCTKGDPYALGGPGDSGGPVFRKNIVLGINKGVCPTNYTCDGSEDVINRHKINLHTGIYPYRKFIDDVMKNIDNLIV